MADTTTPRQVKLVMVTDKNNNKFYDMKDDGTTITVVYGRVEGGTPQTASYPSSKWNSLYNSKVRKGYKDVTHLHAEDKDDDSDLLDITEESINNIINRLRAYASAIVKKNYSLSASNVTQKMIDEAQNALNELLAIQIDERKKVTVKAKVELFNKALLHLFSMLPRKMAKVQEHLLNPDECKTKKVFMEKSSAILAHEQDILDSLASMVMIDKSSKDDDATVKEKKTLLDALGIRMREADDKLIAKVKEMLGGIADKYVNCWYVENIKTQYEFQNYVDNSKNHTVKRFWHGSRNGNWLNILQSGLLIRPTGVATVGSMYGDGIYFADKALKSFGYTSSRNAYWTRGSDNTAIMALYKVHIGKQYAVENHSSDCYTLSKKRLQDMGEYDSTWGVKGADLKNHEFIVYDPRQTTIFALVELKD